MMLCCVLLISLHFTGVLFVCLPYVCIFFMNIIWYKRMEIAYSYLHDGSLSTYPLLKPGHVNDSRHGSSTPGRDRTTPTPTFAMNKPEAVVHAMKVCF